MKDVTFRPKRSLGQNFLVDGNIARKICTALEVQREDVILEIGPGLGVLTKFFLNRARRVIGVEIDSRLIAVLTEKFGGMENFEVIHGDFLKLDLNKLVKEKEKLRVIGNLPYYITSPTIFKIVENREIVQDMTIMIQREVARRIVASPGSKDFGILSVICQYFSAPKILFHVSRNVFSPRPQVDAAVVYFQFPQVLQFQVDSEELFLRIVKTCFGMRRKKLRNSLRSLPEMSTAINDIDFDLNQRPEQLPVEEWVCLSNLIYELGTLDR